jgi:hypothetical protein
MPNFKLSSIRAEYKKEIKQTQEEMRSFQTFNLGTLMSSEFKGDAIIVWNEQITIIDKVLIRRRNGEQKLTSFEAQAKITSENLCHYTTVASEVPHLDDTYHANLLGWEEELKAFEYIMCSKEVGELYFERQRLADAIIKIRLWLSRQGVKISVDGKTLWWPREKKMLWDQELSQQGFSQVKFMQGKIYWSQHGAGLTPGQWELTNSSRSGWVQQDSRWVRNNQPIPVDTKSMVTHLSGPGAGIYVFSKEGNLHISSHKVGQRHHSSLLAGGDVACAGEIWVTNGKITAISNKSGHYHPQTHHLKQMLEHFSKYERLDVASLTVRYFEDGEFRAQDGRNFLGYDLTP